MKLFVVAALIAVTSAARLEHLERGYLPPNGQGQVSNDFGANGQQGFGSQQGVAAARNGGNFGAATSNQYLPPNQGPAGNGRASCCGQNAQEGAGDASAQPQQFGAAANGGAQNFGGARPGSQYQPQLGAAGRQYIAPNVGNNFQNIPQQEFDDQTGYKY